jgi:hypothetical protein
MEIDMSGLKILDKLPRVAGFTSIMSFNPKTGKVSQMVSQKNTIMDGAANAIANLLLGGDEYRVSTMYFEYVNLADPGDSPTPPSFDKSDDVSYYTGLEYSGSVDFLRVPVVADPNIVVNEAGNYVAAFYAVTPGDEEGFWGKAFAAANNSAVYGGALVATPLPTSQANDVIVARNYPDGAKVLKPDGEQIAMVWNIEVQLP